MSNEEYVYEDPKTGEVVSIEVPTAPEVVAPKPSSSRATNFIIPPGMNPGDITLDNYREVTGHRFRMTKDQKDVRSLNRTDAFDESKAIAVSQLEVK